ncbi:MAG: DUF3048 domain-containing protein [bacterium]|nr:DUF3048 domain-containing protein [bacterium]MDN5835596.1 DUF3048 domain-containing protein [bacterium]
MKLNKTKAKSPSKFKNWLKSHRVFVLIISGILLIGIAGVSAYYILGQPPVKVILNLPAPAPKPEPKFYSPLDGTQLKSEKGATKPVNAIMIENSVPARPQSGLKESQVVFEAVAEGGITRFLTLHQTDTPKKIGPVRSIRPYYIDWLAPFDASIVHVGGSAAGKREARSGKFRDVDQFFNSSAYWRSSDRYAPHNVYTSTKRLAALNKKKGYKTSKPKAFDRKDSQAADKPTATKIKVTISGSEFNSVYKYNKKTNTYDRSQGGAPHKDREKGTISPRVVIVMKQKMTAPGGYREKITTKGSGTAYVFQDGTVQKVKWHKKSQFGQMYFTDSEDKHVELARGQTWLVSLPTNKSVSWTGPSE